MIQRRLLIMISLLMLLLPGCVNNQGTENTSGLPDNLQGTEYARKFSLEKEGDHTILRIFDPWQGAVNVVHTHFLVRRGNPIPPGYDSSQVIFVPVRRMISMSTTYLAMISALDADSTIAGISGADLVYSEIIREKVARGEILDVGFEDNLNKELVIKLDPDLVMVYGVGGEASGYLNKLTDLGTKILFNADYLEEEPLGKAEWIKVFGALYCKENQAGKIFGMIVEEYNSVKKLVKDNTDSLPAVMMGLPWKDTWFISPGNSFVSRLIEDAGGSYLWKDTKSETSMPYGVENVWLRAREADYWINISTVKKPAEILNADMRLGELPAYVKGNLYNNNRRIAADGGNDYWESGSLNPHIILKDLAAIIHPDLFQGYELYYYNKVE